MTCRHVWKFDGQAVGAPIGFPCDRPNAIACEGCSSKRVIRCGSSSPRRCGPCSTTYKGRVVVKARSGLRPRGQRPAFGVMGLFLTLTAPGDSEHYLPNGDRCKCTPVGGIDLAKWNASAGVRFNRFMEYLRREFGVEPRVVDKSTGEIVDEGWTTHHFRAAEVQRRGALHFHVLLRSSDGRPLVLERPELRRLALRWGFGHSVDVQPLEAGHAVYVSKYVSKAAGDRADVPWWREVRDVAGTVVKVKPSYRTWSSSPAWGDPMAVIRAVQQHYVMVLEALPAWADRPAPARWSELPVPAVPNTS